MLGRRRLPILVLIASLASASSFALLRGDTRSGPSGRLEVDVVSPRGDVAQLHSIDVVFSDPMVPLGLRGPTNGPPPLRIDPPIRGSFSWIGTRALSFIPQSELPRGRRLTCRVPRGVRSLDGLTIESDYVWEIVVGRPSLVVSVPDQRGALAPGEPIYLLFSAPPASGAADSIRLIGPSGPVDLDPIAPDPAALKQLLPPSAPNRRPENVLSVRPREPLKPTENYRLEIAAGIPFVGSDVGLKEGQKLAFTTYGVPRPVSVAGDESGIELELAGPVDPESLRAYMEVRPSLGSFNIQPLSGTNLRLNHGHVHPGTTYTLRLRAGLPSLFGERLGTDQEITVTTAHRSTHLRIVPSDGYMPRTPGATVQIAATNLDTVEVLGAWLPAERVPERLVRSPEQRAETPLPRIALWHEPRQTPDSARAVNIPLARFGPPPPGARALQLCARGRALFPDTEGKRPLWSDGGIIQVTDLGLSMWSGADRSLAWVTRLSTGASVSGARVQLHLPGEKRPLWTGTTDADGLVWIPGSDHLDVPPQGEPVAQASLDGDAAWLRIPLPAGRYRPRDETGPNVQAGRSGRGSEPQNVIYTFTDRPLYRPGETVRWISLVRGTSSTDLEATDREVLGYRILDPQGERAERGSFKLEAPGQGSGTYTIPTKAPLGMYEIQFTESPDGTGMAAGTAIFRVEEYRLPRFEARLQASPGRAVSGSTVRVEGRFSYLNGGPLATAPVRWTITREPDWETPSDYPEYAFFDHRATAMEETERYGGMIRIAAGEGRLDRDGRILLPVRPDLAGLGQDQIYLVEMGARDLTDRSAYDVTSVHVARAAVRVGARSVNLLGTKDRCLEFFAVCLDSTDHPIPGVPLRWTVERRQWKTVRVRRIGGIFGYENVPQDSIVHTGGGPSGADPLHFRWIPPGAGMYSFLLEAADAQGRTTRARDDVWVSGKETAAWYRDDRGWLELKPDRESYAPGDTAGLLVPAPAIPTEALVLVLDRGIRSVQHIPRLFGSPRVPIPLSGGIPWGTWVQTLLVGPGSVPQGDAMVQHLPYHGWGQVHLDIRPDNWRLNVQVAPDRASYEPGDEVAVRIGLRDAQGQPAAGQVTLAVVDDAIFELAGDETPDPLDLFFSPRDPGAAYADVRWSLHLPARGEKGQLSPGGDGGVGQPGLRRRFVPTVHWAPLVPVGRDGEATIRFRLSDDLTRYRFRVLASSGTDRFGYGESKANVRKPLQIEWATPRFVRDGDRIEAVIGLRAELDRETEISLSCEADGARIDGKKDQKLKARPGQGARAVIRLRDPSTDGVRLRLRARCGDEQDAVEISMPFDRPLLWDRTFLWGRVDPSLRTTIEAKATSLPELGGLTTVVAPSMLSGLDDALTYAIDYPYGCLEQLSSSILGLAAREELERHLGEAADTARAGTEKADLQAKLEAAVAGITRCMEPWELHSWPSYGSPPASDYTVGYALHAATRAREAGLPFPRGLWDRLGAEADRRAHRLWEKGSGERETEEVLRVGPWLLWALSEADRFLPADSVRARIGDFDALFARRAAAPLESRIVLGLALANLRARGDLPDLRRSWTTLSSALLQEIHDHYMQRTGRYVWLHPTDASWGDGIGGDARATALFLRFLGLVDPSNQDLAGLVAWLLDQRQGNRGAWSNDHTTAMTSDLLIATVAPLEGPASQVTGSIGIAGHFEDFGFGSTRSSGAIRRFTPLADLARLGGRDATRQLRVETDGRRVVYLTATLDQAHPALDAPPQEEGLIVDRTYLDTSGKPFEEAIPLGEPLFVHIAIVVSRDARTLLIEDPLPGGIEALNLELRNAPRISMGEAFEPENEPGLSIVYRELRDRCVRIFAEDVAAGVYHLYYPAIATSAGMYKVPGARAELMYSPEIYGTSTARTVRIRGEGR